MNAINMKLIKLNNKFILVSDETPKYGDWCKSVRHNFPQKFGFFENSYEDECKKIIAGIPELPAIDFSLLSDEDCQKIGWVDVHKLANNKRLMDSMIIHKDPHTNVFESGVYQGYIAGFKAAQSLNERLFSLEDIEKAIKFGSGAIGLRFKSNDDFIQSLQQPKTWDVEVNENNQITNIK